MGAPNPQHFKYSEIKDKLLHPAQTSVYLLDLTSSWIANSPLGSFVQKYRNFNHVDQQSLRLLCCDASLPGSGMATHEVTGDFHGVTEKMVYRRIYDDTIDLTFYVDYQYKVLDFFEAWFNYCVGEGSTFARGEYYNDNAYYRMNYPDEYKKDIYLTKFEKYQSNGQPALKYAFIDAFPSNIASMPISYNSSDLLKVTVSFSYTRYVRNAEATVLPSVVTGDLDPPAQAKINKPDNTDLFAPKEKILTNEYYNNGIIKTPTGNQIQGPGQSSQDATNSANFFNGKNVDKGILGASAFA